MPDRYVGDCVPKCVMSLCEFSEQIEAFEKFSAELETQYHQLAKDSQLWQKTVGELYAENYKTFIEVAAYLDKETLIYRPLRCMRSASHLQSRLLVEKAVRK